jgi:NADH dehydrogenase [ubiquinone] 1 alpha subcomplex assembly factor 5
MRDSGLMKGMSSAPILFDSRARRKHLARHAATVAEHDFLWREGAQLMADSLAAISYVFPTIVELAPRTQHLTDLLRQRPGTHAVVNQEIDEEHLPLAENSVDAIVSNLSLHCVNDLPGLFIQARRALKPDGLFLATLPGAASLQELRAVLAQIESSDAGGLSPRVAPFLEVRDAGNLLQRAGFALPVVDSLTLTVTYPHLFALMTELRAAGEANMLQERLRHFTPRSFFMRAAQEYAAQHSDAEGEITVTAEIITITAWKPAANQQQPAKRGSGTTSFHEIF